MTTSHDDATVRALLRSFFDAAVASAQPGEAVIRHLPAKPRGRCVVVGAGKASAAMAAAVDAAWPDVNLSGVVVTRYGYAVPAGRIRIVEAAHPVPDASSLAAAEAVLAAVGGLGPDDLVLALISGGGSSLMTLPAPGLTLADKQAVNAALLASGATIVEMNAVRKYLSAIKGGRLAAAVGEARLVTLVVSDVPGDDPAVIASGPTVASDTTIAEVRAIVERHRLPLPDRVRAHLAAASDHVSPRRPTAQTRIVAAPALALRAVAETVRAAGLTPLILGDAIEGEARELGTIMAGIARSVRDHGVPVAAPAVLLSGGETTVSIGSGPCGRGGRNTELLLGLAVALEGAADIWAIAGDSDGIDGSDDAAGAFVTPDTLARARSRGLDARAFLRGHDSYGFFDAVGDLLKTGPTLTNVNDIRAVLVLPPRTA